MNGETGDEGPAASRAEAHAWIVRMHGPDAEASAEAFQSWLDRDPAQRDIYNDLQQGWDRAKFLTHTRTGRARDLDSVALWHRRPGVRWAAVAAVAMIIAVAGLTVVQFPARPIVEPMVAYTTRIGEVRKVALTDGSKLTLDAATSIQVTMNETKREVRLLDGAARFDVNPDSGRSFAVVTTGGAVSSDGGLFDVATSAGLVRVTAIKGKLSFTRPGETPGTGTAAALSLNPGQRLSLAGSRPPVLAAAPQPVPQDWTAGMLSFDGERLADAVADFNRRNVRKIILSDPAIGDLRITGAYRASDPGGFARALVELFGLTRRDGPDGVIELGPKK